MRICAEDAGDFQSHDIQNVLDPYAKTKSMLDPKRGQRRESTRLVPMSVGRGL